MEAKELRIGNYVYRQNDKLKKQEEGERTALYRIENINLQSALKYDPIPLTEEWLKKFCFNTKEYKDVYPKEKYYSEDVNLYYTNQENFKGFIVSYEKKIIRGIVHVHELQNLYFALTLEELL